MLQYCTVQLCPDPTYLLTHVLIVHATKAAPSTKSLDKKALIRVNSYRKLDSALHIDIFYSAPGLESRTFEDFLKLLGRFD